MSAEATQQKLDWLSRQLTQKRLWLKHHGPSSKTPRPEHNIAEYVEAVEMLESLHRDYVRVLQRYEEMAA